MGARMTFDIWITYVAAYAAICLIPGPSVAMISSTLVVALVLGGYALCAVRVARHLATPRRRAQMQRTSGALMLGGSATLALR